MKALWIAVVMLVIALGAALAGPFEGPLLVGANFDAGAEGWNVVALGDAGPYDDTSLTGDPEYRRSGGNPGGYIRSGELNSSTNYWNAPRKFLGDRSAAYGGVLRYSLKIEHAGGDYFDAADVVLVGTDGTVLVYDMPENPGTSWKTFEVALDENGGWKTDSFDGNAPSRQKFMSALRGLKMLRIRGEYIDGDDAGSLDSVAILGPESSVGTSGRSGGISGGGTQPIRKQPSSYSAQIVGQTDAGQNVTMVYVSGQKIRMEFGRNIVILRKDLGVHWTLLPASRTYVENVVQPTDMDPTEDPLAGATFQAISREMMNGYNCTKYRVNKRLTSGERVSAHVWLAESIGMAVRTESQSRGDTIVEERRNIRVGPQQAGLFEIPEGYAQSARGGNAAGSGKSVLSQLASIWDQIRQGGAVEAVVANRGVPSWVPVYPGVSPRMAGDAQNGSFSFGSDDSPDQIDNYYREVLRNNGFLVTRNLNGTARNPVVSVIGAKGSQKVTVRTTMGAQRTETQVSWQTVR